MGKEQSKKRGVASDPKILASGLADGLSMFGRAEKADDALGYLRRITEAVEKMSESAARQSQEWLDPDDVAAEIKVSRDTAHRLIASKAIRSKKIVTPQGSGRRSPIRVSREWLDDYMNNVDATGTGHDPVSKPCRRRRRHAADSDGETDYFPSRTPSLGHDR